MSPITIPQIGATYYCLICGARVTVLRPGSTELKPRCCGVDMLPVEGVFLAVYFCPICGAEVAVLQDNPESLKLICCGVKMIEKQPDGRRKEGQPYA